MDVKGLKIGSLAFQVKVDIRIGAHEEQIVLDFFFFFFFLWERGEMLHAP